MIKSGLIVPFAVLVIFWILTLIFVWLSKKGQMKTFIRKIGPLDAISELVGRSTEMGKPIVIQPGYSGFTDAGAFAADAISGLTILSYTCDLVAQYDAQPIIPVASAEFLPVVTEALELAYSRHHKQDRYKPVQQIRFFGPNQFSYAVGIEGIVDRENPVANVMVGMYAANSLIIAESFARAGAMQVSGSGNLYQVPFLVGICDFTLIGEEMYAAAAYLSKAPDQLSTIAISDIFKYLWIALAIVGAILISFGNKVLPNLMKL